MTFDPARLLNLFFRVGRDSSRDFVFLDSAGDPLDLTGLTFTAYIQRYKEPILSKVLTVVGNVATWSITAAESNIRPQEYFWRMDVTQGANVETWLTGKAQFHDGIFDGLSTTSETIQVNLNGEAVTIQVTTSSAGGGGVYSGATPANQTVGGIDPGFDPTGLTSLQLWEAALVKYLVPTFGSFSIQGQANTVERGTILTAIQTFLWTTTNPGNIQPNQVGVFDFNNAAPVFGPVANDGSELTNIIPVNFNAVPYVQQYLISSLDTLNNPFDRLLQISAAFLNFFGTPLTTPLNSADVRALPGQTFSKNFTINIAQGQTVISFAYPDTIADIVDASVKYVEGFNSNVGNTFVKATYPVNDAAAVPEGYKIYTSVLGGPYPGAATYNVNLP